MLFAMTPIVFRYESVIVIGDESHSLKDVVFLDVVIPPIALKYQADYGFGFELQRCY
jgi:hypothetical protein